MNVISVGPDFEENGADTASFSSLLSFLDYEVVIIDPSFIIGQYKDHESGKYQGYDSLGAHMSVRLQEDMQRRRSELADILKLGRTIVVSLHGPQLCYVDTGERTYSGTGRNQRTTRIVSQIDANHALPVPGIKTVKAAGELVDFRGPDTMATFWRSYKEVAMYQGYFETSLGTPFLYIKGTEKVVGSVLNVHKGHIIFLPYLPQIEDYASEKSGKSIQTKFYKALIAFIEELKKDAGDFSLPTWTDTFQTDAERAAITKVYALEEKLAKIGADIASQKTKLAEIQSLKLLFSGTGKALEIKTNEVLKAIGFEVTEGLPGRDDLILKYKDQVAVVEVKGVSKSAAEKHAAQLEKWVMEYATVHESVPKGILIVNAFCEDPLNKRKLDPFPGQMIPFCKNRNHCLLTGVQLFNIYLHLKTHPQDRDEIIQEIMSFNGHFDKFQEWNQHMALSKVPSQAKK